MNKFNEAYQTIESLIRKDEVLFSGIEIIALLGSTADGEESIKWSDLDVLVVLKSSGLGKIDMAHINKLKQITEKVSATYDFSISILPHTKDDFTKYVSFEYLKHYSFGKVTYPKPDALECLIDPILEKRSITEGQRRSYCLYHLRHVRFNFIRKLVSINKHNHPEPSKEIVKLLIDKMIKVTDLSLNYYDIWATTKNGILLSAKKYLEIDTTSLTIALQMRSRWNEVTDTECEQFINKGVEYLLDTIDNILKKENNRETPEENMSLK